MPVPRWMARVNRRIFNPIELRRGKRPVLVHVGRASGRMYHTPLDAHRVDGGFIFIVMYGSQSDWVRNVLDAGSARLRIGGDEYALVRPRIIGAGEARRLLPASTKPPPAFLTVTEYLQMDVGEARPPSSGERTGRP